MNLQFLQMSKNKIDLYEITHLIRCTFTSLATNATCHKWDQIMRQSIFAKNQRTDFYFLIISSIEVTQSISYALKIPF